MAKKSKANGEGTISKRKDGRYCGQLVYGRGENGKLIRKTVYGESFDECRKKLNELVAERDSGNLPIRRNKITVGELALHYYLNVKAHKSSPEDKGPGISNKTWNWYVDLTNWYIVPRLSDVAVSKFDKDRAQMFFDSLSPELSPASINGVRRTLSPVMKYALEQSMIKVNPLQYVDMPAGRADAQEDEKALFVEKEDLRFIIRKLDELALENQYTQLRSILLTCVYTGMRIGEVLGLRVRDVDLDKGTVTLRQQSSSYKSRDETGAVSGHTNDVGSLKTKDSRRTLPISNVWRKVLEDRFRELQEQGSPERLNPCAFVFCNGKGEMRTYSGTRSSYLRFMKRIGMEDKGYTLHSFRHSFISHSKAAGMDKDSVSRYVGHANSGITQRIYTHLTSAEKLAIAAGIDRTFSDIA